MSDPRRPAVRFGQERPATFEDFIKRHEGDTGDWIAVPDPSRRYWPGATVPIVGAREYTVLSSGLIVPTAATRGPQPIDLMQVFVTAEEALGQRLGYEFAEYELARVPRDDVLVRSARILGAYEALGADRPALDENLVANWFTEPTATRVRMLLRGDRRLLAPQSLLTLMRMALVISPTEVPGERPNRFPALVLSIQDSLGAERSAANAPSDGPTADQTADEAIEANAEAEAVEELSTNAMSSEPSVFGGETSSPMFREIVQNQAFYAETDAGTLLGRHHLHWVVLPERMKEDPRREDLPGLFQRATSVPFDDFMAVGLALWAIVETRNVNPVPLDRLGLKLSQERIEAALALFTLTADAMREEIVRRQADFQSQWSFDAFRLFPVLRIDDGQLLVLSRRLLLERLFTWLPIHDLRDGLRRQSGDAPRIGERAYHWFRAMCEADAMESLSNLMPASVGVQRFYGEREIQVAFGTKSKNADAALEYPDAWVVTEVSTRHLTRESVAGGSAKALQDDLERGVIKKAGQLDGTIRQLMRNEPLLTGHPAVRRRRFVPVLLITEGFPINPMTMTAIQGRLVERKLLQDPRVGPLHILDQEEVNMVEAIVESGGPSFLELLTGHEQSNLRNMALKDYLIVERGITATRPKRIADPYEKAWQPVLDVVRSAMGGGGDGGEEPLG